MKKHATYIVSTCMLLMLTACEKKLDIASVSNLTNATYYKTPEDAKAALGACYKFMGVLDPFADLVMSDDAVPFLSGAADRVTLWRYNLTPSNVFFAVYAGAYAGINRSNIVIDRVPGITMDEALKERYIAEAKVLRALHYFNLVRLFGGVPISIKETAALEGLNAPRNTADEVYALIEKDLKEAEGVLPPRYNAADAGRMTSGAAKGLLAKVYLTRAGSTKSSPFWAQAAAKAKEVIDQGVYDLYDNYADAFALSARGGKENMIEMQYLTDVYGHGLGRGYGPRSAPIFPGVAPPLPVLPRAFLTVTPLTISGKP
ncbi:RagB/SusD family nutrient uptake outer membrane protein [Chitinophaga horti]|uniref:RagB/SusD family nutrient uptake outer membrane protein n=1 Tax=Chitinophaga horti TaxID=2920382 RepID=A0ABY6IUT5_9BACT|nr:RagB/SusD family nutrient uptake outer membrane protein [Chitinophaga horti]UYQ91144.1 RagB/SusD family nutrient uptake outer membrane protein [Chitinophaga horti]